MNQNPKQLASYYTHAYLRSRQIIHNQTQNNFGSNTSQVYQTTVFISGYVLFVNKKPLGITAASDKP